MFIHAPAKAQESADVDHFCSNEAYQQPARAQVNANGEPLWLDLSDFKRAVVIRGRTQDYAGF